MLVTVLVCFFLAYRIFIYRNSQRRKPKKWMYVLIWTEFGLISTVLLLNFLGMQYLMDWYWVAIIIGIAGGLYGFFSYKNLKDEEKESLESQIEEIGRKG